MEEIIERRINSELAKIEQENDVHVLLAVESEIHLSEHLQALPQEANNNKPLL